MMKNMMVKYGKLESVRIANEIIMSLKDKRVMYPHIYMRYTDECTSFNLLISVLSVITEFLICADALLDVIVWLEVSEPSSRLLLFSCLHIVISYIISKIIN